MGRVVARRIKICVMQWSRLRDLRDVAPIDAEDIACMNELRQVLTRHDRLGRFALHLVHKHFDISADEMLVETSDPSTRELHLHVEPRANAALAGAIPPSWTLDTDRASVTCVCAVRSSQGHLGRHESPSPG